MLMGKPIVVFGSFVVDLTSRSAGLPVPGQTILGNWFRYGPGGKGSNQAVAAHRAGADVVMVTKLGKDVFADVALNFYQGEGMRTDYFLRDEEQPTGAALIMVDEKTAQNEIVVVPGACQHITPEDAEHCRGLIEGASILLLQHEINMDAQRAAIEIAHGAGVRIVLNPAPAMPIPDELMAKIDIVTPNETEAQALTGITVTDRESARKAARVFLDKGIKNVVITMGALGVYVNDGSRDALLPRLEVDAIDTTGAGDAYNGGFVMALAEGRNLFEAARYGNATGALSVTRLGTAPAMPGRAEIDEMVRRSYGL